MIIITHEFNDPYLNLAIEEHFFNTVKDNCFMLWRNSPAVIVGRNQNTREEINEQYIRENNIPVVRRNTGGGAVFHDLGNVNYTFIEPDGAEHFANYARYAAPIISALASVGVKAELTGRNDIEIDGKKVSGNAQYARAGRMMHHGTLLFSACCDDITKALKANSAKFQSKSVKSVSSRVSNISAYLKQPMDIKGFISLIVSHVMMTYPGSSLYTMTPDDIAAAQKLRDEKYIKWEWNYGQSPAYTQRRELRFPCGTFDARLDVRDGVIVSIRIFGDYFSVKPIEELEAALRGVRCEAKAIEERLSTIDAGDYISGMTNDQLLQLLT